MEWIISPLKNVPMIAVSVFGIWLAVVVFTRIAGVRSFSKLSGFDFAVTVAIGSVVAGISLSKEPPLMQGVIALACLFAVQMGVAALRIKFSSFREMVDNEARLIMIGDQILEKQMKAAKIGKYDLKAKLREANIIDYRQIEAVVAETTGDISVLHRDLDGPYLDPQLLDGVIGAQKFREYHQQRSEQHPLN